MGSENTAVLFRKVTDGRHIKHISVNISASRSHTIEILVSKHMFARSKNTTVRLRKAADGGYIGFSRRRHIKTYFYQYLRLTRRLSCKKAISVIYQRDDEGVDNRFGCVSG